MKQLRDQRGFTAVEIVLAVLALGAIGVAVYYAYQNYSKSTSPSPSPTASATVTPTSTPKVSYLDLKEFGAKFVLPAELYDLTYTYSASDKTVRFSSKTLEARSDFVCKGTDGPAGIFYKGNDTTVGPDQSIQKGSNTKVIAGVYYDLEATQIPCFSATASKSIQATTMKALAGAITTTLIAD